MAAMKAGLIDRTGDQKLCDGDAPDAGSSGTP